MPANNNKDYISLRVWGRPASAGGLSAPIVEFNRPMLQFNECSESYAGFSDNSYFFSVRTERNQVVYKLFQNRTRSHAATREGPLVLAIGIPRGTALSGGDTPLQVLLDLREALLSKCMDCRDSVREVYEFKTDTVPLNVLDEVAQRFQLVVKEGTWAQMAQQGPVGCLQLPEEQIRLLLSDVHFPAFAELRELVVAEKVNAAEAQSQGLRMLSGITVPRVPVYKIYEGGVLKHQVSDVEQSIQVSSNKEERYYVNSSESFTIQGLLEQDAVSGVSLDPVREEVHVSPDVLARPKKFKVPILFQPAESASYFENRADKLRLLCSGHTVRLSKGESGLSFTLMGEEWKWVERPSVVSLIDEDGNASVPAPLTHCSQHADRGRAASATRYRIAKCVMEEGKLQVTTHTPSDTPPARLALTVELTRLPHESRQVVMTLSGWDGQHEQPQYPKLQRQVEFKEVNVKGVIVRRAIFSVPASFDGVPNPCLHFDVGKTRYLCHLSPDSLGQRGATLKDNNFTQQQPRHRHFYSGWSDGMRVLLLVVPALLLGMLLGVAGGWLAGKLKKCLQEVPADTVMTEPVSGDELAGPFNVEDFLRQTKKTLENSGLTFQEVDSILVNYYAHLQECEDKDPALCGKIDAYSQVAQALKTGDILSLQVYAERSPRDFPINNSHHRVLYKLLIGRINASGGSKAFTPSQKDQAADYVRNHLQKFNSFADLKLPDSVITAAPASVTARDRRPSGTGAASQTETSPLGVDPNKSR